MITIHNFFQLATRHPFSRNNLQSLIKKTIRSPKIVARFFILCLFSSKLVFAMNPPYDHPTRHDELMAYGLRAFTQNNGKWQSASGNMRNERLLSSKEGNQFISFPQKITGFLCAQFGGFSSYFRLIGRYALETSYYSRSSLPVAMGLASLSSSDDQKQLPPKTTRILTIDGGGIRGIIPAKILCDIERLPEFQSDTHIAEYFDFIAGTSTGGIIALGLNVPDKKNYYRPKFKAPFLFNLYKNHGQDIFPQIGWGGTLANTVKPKHDVESLEKYLEDCFGNSKFSKSISRVLVTAYDVMQDRPIFFKSYEKGHNYFAMKYVARATSAAPTYFKGAEFKDFQGIRHHYIDGGVFANNPTFEALLEVRRLEEKGILTPANRYVILSLGTGDCPTANYWEKVKEGGNIQWAQVIPSLMMNAFENLMQSHLTIYLEELKKQGIECDYIRIQPNLALEHMEMDNVAPSNIDKLIAVANGLSKDYSNQIAIIRERIILAFR